MHLLSYKARVFCMIQAVLNAAGIDTQITEIMEANRRY